MSRHFFVRFLNAFLILSVAVDPASALRPQPDRAGLEETFGPAEPLPMIEDSDRFIDVVQWHYHLTSAFNPSPVLTSRFANPCVIGTLYAPRQRIMAVVHVDQDVCHLESVRPLVKELELYGAELGELQAGIYGVRSLEPAVTASLLKEGLVKLGIPEGRIQVHLSLGKSRSIAADARNGQVYDLKNPGRRAVDEGQLLRVFQKWNAGPLRPMRIERLVDARGLPPFGQVLPPPPSTAGMEEEKRVSKADLEEAKLRVLYALSLLTAESALQWQVAGMSVVAQYPAVQFLDRYLLHFQIDPGDVGSELLAESLRRQHPPAERLVYYGSPEEFNHFKGFAQGRGIFPGEKPVEPGTLTFELFLKQLLSNLTSLPEEDMLHRLREINYPLSRLAADLELIAKA